MTEAAVEPRAVGVDIQENEQNRPVVEAIEADNAEATVRYLPGMVRISAPGRLVINRETVEERMGREWETHEFQLAIISYFGHIKEWDDDQILIAWDH
ncbi:MAG TPA: MmoB/DmpM family protein [Phycicoccus sp.]|jgi:phenol hydroxylase P2 protein|nr:MmoB/DmpM family protein [Phycicoccus sp.]HQK32455.1 MmoB/DmpM family protein [Phycicoccus sp.]HQV92609.1 MmoB/DmpM family protein [Phycicoccus sp.]HQY96980.1 MmoB/DmpM family protein [Phycicoccus sp.]HRA46014.1 MmoB/DmpM family protein [Phycicoccus sp.]